MEYGLREEEGEVRKAGAGGDEAMGCERCAFGVDICLSPNSFISSHVHNELDAVEANCLRPLNGTGEKHA